MSLLPVGFGSAAGDYEITDSLRFRQSAGATLSRTPASATNRRTFTLSCWVKRGALGSNQGIFSAKQTKDDGDYFYFASTDKLVFLDRPSNSSNIYLVTNQVFRDVSAWYHIVLKVDTTQATEANRVQLYVNGTEITSFSTSTYPTQNYEVAYINNTQDHRLGQWQDSSPLYLDGYLTEVNFIDGQALTPSDFGEYDDNGTWKPKQYTGTYGTNGFYLPMKPTTQADGFNTVTFSADGSAASVTGVGFTPDFIWAKNRTNAYNHELWDSVRGVNSTLFSNASAAEDTTANRLVSIDTDGFSYGTSSNLYVNNTDSVAWCWDAGSGSAASNTTGDINSTVKANDTYGFSIVSYTGNGTSNSEQTIGHGLSTAPKAVIVKNRTSGTRWQFYSTDLSSDATYAVKNLLLNTTGAESAYSSQIRGIQASNTFSVRDVDANGNANVNKSGDNYIAYCFAEIAGYSKMGSYTGTGTTTGNVTTTGFRPAFLMVKATTTTSEWVILDNTRDPNPDPAKNVLHPNNTNADSTAAAGLYVKFTDTGFQPVGVGTDTNSSGQTYIYMAFADTRDAVFNFDASGNKNNFEPFNINSNGESETTYDLMKDTPSLVDENAANFATFNPLAKTSSASTSNANLTGTTNTSTTEMILSTVGVSSGKWYWEVTPTSITSGGCMIGIRSTAAGVLANNFVSSTDGFGYYTTGNKYSPGASASYGASYTTNDVIGVALDMDAGTLTFYKNNVSQGTAFTSISGTYTPGISNGGATSGCTVQINFGQRPFAYTPPTGFLKLNTFNLPDLTIEDGSDYFAPVIYTGNGSNQDITTEHASDFVWIKSRSSTTSHGLYDNVRGTNKPLNSNNTNAEADYGAYGVDAFLSTGFGVTDIASSGYGVNENTVSYVAWSWKANGSGSSNTDGSVTSTVSANTTAGFSIVGFTAPSGTGNFTAGHGLGVTPAMVIVKTRDSGSAPWYTWSNTFSNLTDDYIRLNATSAKQTQSSGWGAGMTSSVIGLRAGYTTVATEDHIAYCFVEVEGYSSFGKYTGNGSTDGPFVYTGFRPAFIITKNSSGTGGWHMTDTTRFAFNSSSQMGYLDADTTAADVTARIYNTFANGFQIRDNGSVVNTNGSTYIYMAFAENPFKNANAR